MIIRFIKKKKEKEKTWLEKKNIRLSVYIFLPLASYFGSTLSFFSILDNVVVMMKRTRSRRQARIQRKKSRLLFTCISMNECK
jgi:hypothetical protein